MVHRSAKLVMLAKSSIRITECITGSGNGADKEERRLLLVLLLLLRLLLLLLLLQLIGGRANE